MSSFEPLMPSLLEKFAFTPLGGGGAPAAKIVSGPLRDLNPSAAADEAAAEALRQAEERALLEQAAYARGVAEGRAIAEAELAQLVQGMGEVIAELTRFRHDTMTRYQSELLDLALEVARKVVDRELGRLVAGGGILLERGIELGADGRAAAAPQGRLLDGGRVAGIGPGTAQ